MSVRKLMLLLIGAIALAVAVFVYRQHTIVSQFDSGRYQAGILGVKSLQMKVEAYQLDVGSPPTSLSDLVAQPAGVQGWKGPYARESSLADPFGHPFQFHVPGEHGKFDIVFLGKDGEPGGSGINADFGNWQIGP